MAARPDCHGRCGLAAGSRPGLHGLELAESRRVICGRSRVPALGSVGPRPQGREACSLQPRSRSPEPSFGPRLFPGQVRCVLPGEGGDALPACGCSQRSGRLQSLSLGCLGPPAEKHVLSHHWPLEPKGSRGQLTDLLWVPRDDDG